jgi:outer membrane protein
MKIGTSSWLSSSLVVAITITVQAQPAPKPQPEPPPASAAAAGGVERLLPDRADAPERVLVPEAGGLTADEVARRTLASSPTVRAKLAELEAANAKIRQTTVQFFPRLTLRAQYSRLSPVAADLGTGALVGARNPGLLGTGPCPPPSTATCVVDSAGQPVGAASFQIESLENNYALSAGLVVPLSDYVLRLSHAAAAAQAGRAGSEFVVRAERLKVRSEARSLYYGWVGAVGQVSVAEKSVERSRARLSDASAAFQLGTISRADLFRLEALVASTELAVKEAQTLRDLRARQLAILMGERGTPLFKVGENVLAPPPSAIRGSLDALTSEALSRRLELKALAQNSRALRRGSEAIAAGGYPQLEAFGDLTYANPNQRFFPQQQEWNLTWMVGVSATWSINDSFASSASAAELRANAKTVEAQQAALRDGIRQEVAAAYLDREKAVVAIETSRRGARAAAEAYRVATDLYQVGRATTTELIEAEADLLNAKLTELNAHVGLRVAEERLKHATGRDVTARQ